MVLTLMITASAAAAMNAAPTTSADKGTTSIVSTSDNENENEDVEEESK